MMTRRNSGFVEGTDDIDGDGIPNKLDLDSDNDGCFDAQEGGLQVLIVKVSYVRMPVA